MCVRHAAYGVLENMDTKEGFFFSVIVVAPSLGGITACRRRPFLPRVPADGMVSSLCSVRGRVRGPRRPQHGELRRAGLQPLPDLGPEFLVRRGAHRYTDMAGGEEQIRLISAADTLKERQAGLRMHHIIIFTDHVEHRAG